MFVDQQEHFHMLLALASRHFNATTVDKKTTHKSPSSSAPRRKPHVEAKREKEPKKPVIKKPLNAFMLYMKEMRAKVIAECTLKESAAINQILGRRVRTRTH